MVVVRGNGRGTEGMVNIDMQFSKRRIQLWICREMEAKAVFQIDNDNV